MGIQMALTFWIHAGSAEGQRHSACPEALLQWCSVFQMGLVQVSWQLFNLTGFPINSQVYVNSIWKWQVTGLSTVYPSRFHLWPPVGLVVTFDLDVKPPPKVLDDVLYFLYNLDLLDCTWPHTENNLWSLIYSAYKSFISGDVKRFWTRPESLIQSSTICITITTRVPTRWHRCRCRLLNSHDLIYIPKLSQHCKNNNNFQS